MGAAVSQVTAERLGALPQPVLAELRRALLQGDTERAVQLTRQLDGHDEPLAAELRGLIEAFRLDDVEAALGEVRPG